MADEGVRPRHRRWPPDNVWRADPAAHLELQGPAALRHALEDSSVPLADAVIELLLPGPDGAPISGADLPTRVGALHRAAAVIAGAGEPGEITRLTVHLAARLDLAPATVTAVVCDAVSPPPAVSAHPHELSTPCAASTSTR